MHVDESASIADFYFKAIVFLPTAPNKEEVFSISPSFKATLMEKGALVEFTQYLNSKKDSRGFQSRRMQVFLYVKFQKEKVKIHFKETGRPGMPVLKLQVQSRPVMGAGSSRRRGITPGRLSAQGRSLRN